MERIAPPGSWTLHQVSADAKQCSCWNGGGRRVHHPKAHVLPAGRSTLKSSGSPGICSPEQPATLSAWQRRRGFSLHEPPTFTFVRINSTPADYRPAESLFSKPCCGKRCLRLLRVACCKSEGAFDSWAAVRHAVGCCGPVHTVCVLQVRVCVCCAVHMLAHVGRRVPDLERLVEQPVQHDTVGLVPSDYNLHRNLRHNAIVLSQRMGQPAMKNNKRPRWIHPGVGSLLRLGYLSLQSRDVARRVQL